MPHSPTKLGSPRKSTSRSDVFRLDAWLDTSARDLCLNNPTRKCCWQLPTFPFHGMFFLKFSASGNSEKKNIQPDMVDDPPQAQNSSILVGSSSFYLYP